MFVHNTSDIVNQLAEKVGMRKDDAKTVVDALIGLIIDSAVQRIPVRLHGLGTFQTVDRKARKARDIKSKQMVEVPARVALVFRPTKHLRNI